MKCCIIGTSQCKQPDLNKIPSDEAGAVHNPTIWGATVGKQEPVGFYRELKSLAIWGCYISEYIGKNVLNYDLIPGGKRVVFPLKKWAIVGACESVTAVLRLIFCSGGVASSTWAR